MLHNLIFSIKKNLLSICIRQDCPTGATIAQNYKISVAENFQKFISYSVNLILCQLGPLLHFLLSLSLLESSPFGMLLFTNSKGKKQWSISHQGPDTTTQDDTTT